MLSSPIWIAAWFAGCSDPAAPPDGDPPAPDEAALIDAARGWLGDHVDPRSKGDPAGYDVLRAFTDSRGLGHVHFQQRVDDVPVFGGQILVHLFADHAVRAITDDLVAVSDLHLTPTLSADDADDAVPADPFPDEADGDFALPPPRPPELWILPGEPDHLVWSVQRSSDDPEPTRPRVFVDAHDGAEVWRYEQLHTVQIDQATRYDGVHTVDAYQTGGTKYLEDPVRDFSTITMQNTSTQLFRVSTTSPTFPDTTAAQLHWGTAQVLDYLDQEHGRDGIDGSGGPGLVPHAATGIPALTGAAHYGFRVNNAFWDPTNEFFAAGDGYITFAPLVSLDIVAHELTHGVNQYESGLIYANESGAVDESLADVMGAVVEAWSGGSATATWRIAEDCFTPSTANDALRYLDDPTDDGSSRDHYASRYVGGQDNGGVHWNSGIGNLAFYLASEGGNHPRLGGTAISGVGIDSASAIWFTALTSYVTSSTGFQGLRTATINAAEDLYGSDSPEVEAVDGAWALVGVTPWVLQGSGWSAAGVGSPAVAYRPSTGHVILAYESRTSPPSAACPHGQWGVGLATSTDGRTFTPIGAGPVIGAAGSGWRSCVAAHPTVVLDDAGTGLHLWFKAETDTTACSTEACLYSGVGYAHVTSALTATDVVSSGAVVPTAEVLGYPSVVRVAGTYHMALQSDQAIVFATASAPGGPWTVDPTPALEPGVTPWAADEVYNPALVCQSGPTPFRAFFGGRRLDQDVVVDGGIGDASSDDAADWVVPSDSVYAFEGNERWRHWSAVMHGADPVFYYAQTVGGVNRIGVRTRLATWSTGSLRSRTCP